MLRGGDASDSIQRLECTPRIPIHSLLPLPPLFDPFRYTSRKISAGLLRSRLANWDIRIIHSMVTAHCTSVFPPLPHRIRLF